jgi:uncharacterized protein YndB with AHSA1/START domain
MSEAPLLPIVAEIRINAPIERVWQVLTSEQSAPQWLGCMDYRREVGATFFMQQDPELRAKGDTTDATHCTVTLIQEPHKFNFTWFVPGTPETLVQISLFSEGPSRSFVRLMHDGWDQFEPDPARAFYDQLALGWRDNVLPGLRRLAESTS